MQTEAAAFEQLKQRMRSTWMAGDFGQIARHSAVLGEDFIARLPIVPGMRILDVACGTGNVAIPAARKGAQVVGVDIAPNLLEQARCRAHEEGLTIQFDEGDVENLPYADAAFELVTSMFGAMFAPQPSVAAAEMARVTKPGGLIAMGNWTSTGFAGKQFALAARYAPPPEGVPPAALWGNERIVRERFGTAISKIDTVKREAIMAFPFTPEKTVRFFITYFGPAKLTFERLNASGQAAFTADLVKLWSDHNEAPSGQTMVRNEYLEVIAVRA